LNNQNLSNNSPNFKRYFVNFPVDFFFLCGISFILYAWAWTRGVSVPISTSTQQIISSGAWFINWPHFSATAYRLYSNGENRRQFPLTTYVAPVVLLALFFLGLQAPDTLGVGFVKLFFLWSAMHFSAQSFGLTQLYLGRSGHKIGEWERRLLWSVIYFSFLYTFIAAQVGPTGNEFFGMKIPSFQFPELLRQVSAYAYGGLLSAFCLWFFLQKMRRPHFPWMVFWLPVTQFIWYSLYFVSFFNEFVPTLHCIQYLFLAYFVEGKEKGGFHTPLRLFWISSKWYGLNVVGGAVLFFYLPKIGPEFGYADAGVFTAMVWALVQMHHFFVDGVIWRLRYAPLASPLQATWSELRKG
jgi:hypothetical protein